MGKRKIALEVKDSQHEVLQKLQSILKEAGYKVKIKSKERLVFTKGSNLSPQAPKKTHKLHVSFSPLKVGVSISILIETGVGEPVGDLDTIETYIRNLIDSSFQVANLLINAKVSDDGREVHSIEDNNEIFIGPFENIFGERGRGPKILLTVVSIFFSTVLAGYIYDLIFDISGTAYLSQAPYFIAFILFFILLGPAMLLYHQRTIKMPHKILPTFEGVYLYYLKKPTIFVPWNQVLSIEIPRGYNIPGLFWKTDNGKKVFAAMHDPAAGFVIDMHNMMLKGFDKLYASSAYKAFSIVPPKTEILIAKKPLSDTEIRYRKLARRFLVNGPPIPVYITYEEHVRLAREYLNKSNLNKEELKDAAKQASSQMLWDFGAELFGKLVTNYPDDEDYTHDLAGCLLEADRVQEGLKVIDTYLKEHPNSSRCNVMKAILAMKIQRIDEALHHIGRAVELDPNNIQALSFWFEIVGNQSGTAQAISELDYLTTKYPEAWGPHIVLGYRALNSEQIEEAQKYMNKAYEIEINEETVIGLAVALYVKQDIDEMIKIYEGYGEDKTLSPQMIINLAEGYFKRGEGHKAYEMLKRINYSMGIEWVDAADDLLMIIHKSV